MLWSHCAVLGCHTYLDFLSPSGLVARRFKKQILKPSDDQSTLRHTV